MSLWESLFAHLQQPVAQILLTRNDIADVRKNVKCGLGVWFADEGIAYTISERPEYIQ